MKTNIEVYWRGELVGSMPIEAESEEQALEVFKAGMQFDVLSE